MEILEQSKIVHLDEKALLNSFLFWLLQLQITGMILIADRIYDALKVKKVFHNVVYFRHLYKNS